MATTIPIMESVFSADFVGNITAQNPDANLDKILTNFSVSSKEIFDNPGSFPLFSSIANRAGKKNVTQAVHRWQINNVLPRFDIIDATVDIGVSNAVGVGSNAVRKVKNIEYYQDVDRVFMKVTKAGDLNGEIGTIVSMRVISVNAGTSEITLKPDDPTKRVPACDADVSVLHFMASAYPENSKDLKSRLATPENKENYLQIIRDAIELSSLAGDVDLFDGGTVRERAYKSTYLSHINRIEMMMFYAKAFEEGKLRGTGGILNFLSSNEMTGYTGDFDYKKVDEISREPLTYSNTRVVYMHCGADVVSQLNTNIVANQLRVLSAEQDPFGYSVNGKGIIVSCGLVIPVYNPLFDNDLSGDAFIVSPEYLDVCGFKDTKGAHFMTYKMNIEEERQDGTLDEIHTKILIELLFPKGFHYAYKTSA